MERNTADLIRNALAPRAKKPILDSAADDAGAGPDDVTIADITLSAAGAIQQWAETDDLAEGETYADRLMALLVGIADANKDGDISEDEQGVLDVAVNTAWDYLTAKGVSDDDANALLNDWDADAASRVRELVCAALPDGDEAAAEDIDNFVFGADDQEPLLDAAYKMRFAIRNGKKTRVKKRISGTVHLSAAQKVAIRKARMKSHNATAMMRRMKSNRMRSKMGMNK